MAVSRINGTPKRATPYTTSVDATCCYASSRDYQLQPGGFGLGGGVCLAASAVGQLLVGYQEPGLGGFGECLRRSRSEAAGAKSGA